MSAQGFVSPTGGRARARFRRLAPKHAPVCGIIGSGAQARFQAECLKLVRDFEQLFVYSLDTAGAVQYAKEMSQQLDVPVDVCTSAEEVLDQCTVVVTTTPSETPVIRADWLKPGQHITAVGCDLPGKQELESACLDRADLVVCDSKAQCRVGGELQHLGTMSATPVRELSELTSGAFDYQRAPDDITICDLTGMGVQDTAIAAFALTRLDAAES